MGVAKRKRMQPKVGRKKKAKRTRMPGIGGLDRLNPEVREALDTKDSTTYSNYRRVGLAANPNITSDEPSTCVLADPPPEAKRGPKLSFGAARYMKRLIAKHGDDTQAMFRDYKLNNEQLSVGRLGAMLRQFRAIYGDELERVPEKRLKSTSQLRAEAEAERVRAQQRAARRLLAKQSATATTTTTSSTTAAVAGVGVGGGGDNDDDDDVDDGAAKAGKAKAKAKKTKEKKVVDVDGGAGGKKKAAAAEEEEKGKDKRSRAAKRK